MLTPLLRWLAERLAPYQPLPPTAPQDPILARRDQDATAAIQAALDTGLRVRIPSGHYTVSAPLICRTPGQIIEGEGLGRTFLDYPTTGYRDGLFLVDHLPEPGPEFQEFAVICQQPGETRQTLVSQAPVFDVRKTPRCRFQEIRVERARTAISLTGNCGGTYIEGCEISAFDRAVSIARIGSDYSMDSMRLLNCHLWVFGMSPAQQLVQGDGVARNLYCEQADDLNVQGCILYGAGVTLLAGLGSFSSVDFDTSADLDIRGGLWTFTGGEMTGIGDRPLAVIRNAEVSFSGTNCLLGNLDLLPAGRAALEIQGGRTTITGLSVRWGGGQANPLIDFHNTRVSWAGGDLSWLHVDWPTPQPVITVRGACRASLTGLTASDILPSTGQVLIRALETENQVLVTHGLVSEGRALLG